MIRKIIGFIPAALPLVLCWVFMTDLMNPMAKGLHPGEVPWYMWLWLAASVGSGVLLCCCRLIPLGLLLGGAPYLVFLVQSFSSEEAEFLRIFAVCCLTFFLAYAVSYYIYHRTLNKS